MPYTNDEKEKVIRRMDDIVCESKVVLVVGHVRI